MPSAAVRFSLRRSSNAARRSGVVACATLLLAAALTGCGGSSSGSPNANPASVVPASAPLYASIALKPSGGSSGPAYTDLKTLTHLSEPYGSVAQSLLSVAGAHSEYSHDVEPWVGATAGVFVTSLGASVLPSSSGSAQSLFEGLLSGKLSGHASS